MALLADSLWAALFSLTLGVLLATPTNGLLPCALCGFAGRFVRDGLVAVGASEAWGTVVGAAAVAVVALFEIRKRQLAPAAIIGGVFPLGAAYAVFETIIGLLRVAALEGQPLREAAVELVASAGRAFTMTLAIALGLGVGLASVRTVARLRGAR